MTNPPPQPQETAQQKVIKARNTHPRSRPAPTPQWTDDEVMKEIQDAFDRGVASASDLMTKDKETTIHNATLDVVLKALQDVVLIDENNQYYFWLEDVELAIEILRGKP